MTYEDDPKNDKDEASLPPAWKGYLCVAAIIGLSLLFQWFGITAIQATTYAQVLSIACFSCWWAARGWPIPSRPACAAFRAL